MLPEPHSTNILHNTPLAVAIAAIAVLVIGGVVFYVQNIPAEPVEYVTPNIPTAVVAPEKESLGGALYEKANNPLLDKLPEQSPVANPIEDAYTNPF